MKNKYEFYKIQLELENKQINYLIIENKITDKIKFKKK